MSEQRRQATHFTLWLHHHCLRLLLPTSWLKVERVGAYAPICKVSVCGHHYTVLKCQNFLFSCRAGSRYEQPNTLGITHALRIAAGLTTKDSTQFGIMRNLQQIGATLTCQTDRETIAYTLQSTSDSV